MSSTRYHADILDTWDWQARSLIDQLGNIGAEAGRAIQAKNQNNAERLQWSWHRMDELFQSTIGNKALRHTRRLTEVLRAREVTYSYLEWTNEYLETGWSLERYWMEWGILANMERKRNRANKKVS
jgi:hypothetical protein